MSLNDFYKEKGISIQLDSCEQNDAFLSNAQEEQFMKELKKHPEIQSIAEIGLNAGHSASHFFEILPSLKLLVSFDINIYPCVGMAAEYLSKKYKERFLFIEGDSLNTVPFFSEHCSLKFDLIYIDGCHHFNWVLGDIANVRKIAHENTILWIDDVDYRGVKDAVRFSEQLGYIQVQERFHSKDPISGTRDWLQAKILL